MSQVKRAIIELSSMINNEEYFFHYIDEEDLDVALKKLKDRFNNPRVRCRRIVLDEEIQQGLDPTKHYRPQEVWDNPNIFPEITVALDAMGKLHQSIHVGVGILRSNPHQALIDSIAYTFYDCMSGGADGYFLAMCRHLIETHNVDLSMDIYPKYEGDGWHTVQDFLNEIKGVPRFEKKFPQINTKLLVENTNED